MKPAPTNELQSIVSGDGRWKLQLPHTYRSMEGQAPGKGGVPGKYKPMPIAKAELYDLTADVGEGKGYLRAEPRGDESDADLGGTGACRARR